MPRSRSDGGHRALREPQGYPVDVCGGANDLRQLVARPRALHPYETGTPGVLLCSASTPAGAGVHGMAGYNAARAALHGHHARGVA